MADLASVGEDTVCRLERGESTGRISTLRKLAKALHVPLELIAELDAPVPADGGKSTDEPLAERGLGSGEGQEREAATG